MWTNDKIETFFLHAVKGSELAQSASGVVTKRGRPADSQDEDITIKTLSNSGCGQTQRAWVNVNVYVPNQYNSEHKAWEENTRRIGELATLCDFLFHIHGDGLMVRPEQCSQTTVPTQAEAENGQGDFFINNKIFLEINNE